MKETRFSKSFMNAKTNLVFYFISLFLSFFSRKIFLDDLSADFIGLVGTLGNILSFLNLAELGIGQAIGYVLYKPIFNKDNNKINEIVSVFGYLYSRIGYIILAIGIILSLFFPLIFSKTNFPLPAIYFSFYAFLSSSLLSYFYNYKQTLLDADQKNYVVTIYFQTTGNIKTIIQIIVAYKTHNYYYWIIIELLFGFISSFILNWKIKQVYPWLKSKINSGKLLFSKYPEIKKYTKQLFVHRIAYFILSQTDSILIYAFVSLKYVAYYGNYTVIISKLALFINNVMDGTSAGVGNLIAEGNKKNTFKVYWEITSIKYYFAGIMAFSLYYLTSPFISLWLGKEYILDTSVLIFILINTYLSQTRGANDLFINGYGLFNDVWAPCTEAIINFIFSIILGYYLGLIGILIGTTISLFLIVCLWKPYFLFNKGFKEPVLSYWLRIIKLITVTVIAWFISSIIIQIIPIIPSHSFTFWGIYSLITVFTIGTILYFLLLLVEQGMKDFSSRILKKVFEFLHR